jgi:nucleophosmin 3
MIKQAILSHEAAEGEMAVIEAEAVGYAQANIKTLISVLVQGKDHQQSLDLVFHDAPVKLRLIKGSGPVHLVGAHGVGMYNNHS